jgi:hypothetical protein
LLIDEKYDGSSNRATPGRPPITAEIVDLVIKFKKENPNERIHQSLGRIIEPKHNVSDDAEVQCSERLGGLLKSYHRLAA